MYFMVEMKRVITLALTICCLGCWHGDRNILLRLKYKPGDQLDVKYHTYIVANNDLDNPITNEIVRMSFKVDSVNGDSLYMMSAKIDYLRVESGGAEYGNTYSSDQDEADMSPQQKQIHAAFKPMLDSTYKLIINTKGQIIKPFAIGGPSIAQNFQPLNYSNCQVVFPAGKIAVGEDWSSTAAMPIIGGKRISSYHIENVFDGKIQIKESGRLTLNQGDSHEFSGRYMLDEKTKNLISAKIELDADSFGEGRLKAVIEIEVKNWGFM